MTITEMISNLRNRVEDADSSKWTTNAPILEALNNGQLNVAILLHPNYLTEIIVEKTNLALAGGISGALTEAVLGYEMIKGDNGIVKDSIKVPATGRYCKKYEKEDQILINNSMYDGTNIDPIYLLINNKLLVRPTSIASVNLSFIRKPATLTGSQSCELNASLHDIVLDFAEAELWSSDEKIARAQLAWTKATQEISALNSIFAQPK